MADTYVNGRRALLQCLDSLLAEERNIKTFKEAFQAEIDASPMKFFVGVVMPLMPKDQLNLSDKDESKTPVLNIQFVPKPD